MKIKNTIHLNIKPLAVIFAFTFLITILVPGFDASLYAQDQQEKQETAKEKQEGNKETAETPKADDTLPPQETQEEIIKDNDLSAQGIDTQEFVYQPRGRRDPFWNLLQGKNVRLKREAKEGIAGLLIDELELEGIILKEGQFIALFKGPDGRPYDVKIGDNVYDGEILDININAVVFKRTLTTTSSLGGTKEKLITKRLVPDEEAAKK